jgi:hypothetical protein
MIQQVIQIDFLILLITLTPLTLLMIWDTWRGSGRLVILICIMCALALYDSNTWFGVSIGFQLLVFSILILIYKVMETLGYIPA